MQLWVVIVLVMMSGLVGAGAPPPSGKTGNARVVAESSAVSSTGGKSYASGRASGGEMGASGASGASGGGAGRAAGRTASGDEILPRKA
jgi:hypothetical protein